MRRNKQTSTKGRLNSLFILVFLSMLIFGLYQIQMVVQNVKEEYSSIKQVALTATAMMHYDDLLKLSAVPEDTVKVEYDIIKSMLADITRVNTSAKFAYVYTIRDGKVLFVADSEPKSSSTCSPAGQELTEATALDKSMMDAGSEPVIEFSEDRWGNWVSVLVPLKHPVTLKNIAVFGMDFEAKVWKAKHLKDLFIAILVVLLSLAAILFIFRIISNSQKLKEDFLLLKQAEADLLIAKERAEESDRLKTAFLKNISHEIRTPMNSILGFANLLKEQNLTAEDKEIFLNNMANSGERMLNTIYDIIELSRIQSGQVKPVYRRTNMQEQIDMIREIFHPVAQKKQLECSCEVEPGSMNIVFYTDTDMLHSVLQKLLWNAFKFTSEGFVKVGYEVQDSNLCFWVKDSGVGVDATQQSFIFEYFRQGNETLTRNFEGAGTGLAIAKAHVEILGGKIWVESEPGVGSTFYFTIPYYEHEPIFTN